MTRLKVNGKMMAGKVKTRGLKIFGLIITTKKALYASTFEDLEIDVIESEKMPNTITSLKRRLSIYKFVGSANTCPKCGKSGEFSSITRFNNGKNDYLICGWCGKHMKVKE